MLKLAQLQPRWDHGSNGHRTGITFTCPVCKPHGQCLVSFSWQGRHPHDSEVWGTLSRLTFEDPVGPGSEPSCKFLGKLTDGSVVIQA